MFDKKQDNFALLLGLIAFVLVFLINWNINLLSTSFIRGIIAFVIFFFIGYLIHIFVFQINYKKPSAKNSSSKIDLKAEDTNGFNLNDIYQTTKDPTSQKYDIASKQAEFQPLDLKTLEVTEETESTENDQHSVDELVKGVRTFNNE